MIAPTFTTTIIKDFSFEPAFNSVIFLTKSRLTMVEYHFHDEPIIFYFFLPKNLTPTALATTIVPTAKKIQEFIESSPNVNQKDLKANLKNSEILVALATRHQSNAQAGPEVLFYRFNSEDRVKASKSVRKLKDGRRDFLSSIKLPVKLRWQYEGGDWVGAWSGIFGMSFAFRRGNFQFLNVFQGNGERCCICLGVDLMKKYVHPFFQSKGVEYTYASGAVSCCDEGVTFVEGVNAGLAMVRLSTLIKGNIDSL
jgi:hypothetical protein